MNEAIIDIEQKLMEQYEEKERIYRSFLDEIKHQIKGILEASKITYNTIDSRLKSPESVAEKIRRKQGKYSDLSEITDIAGVRITTYYASDVDRIAEIIESEFSVDQENSIDKRESMEPDRFGYCSVHYVVGMSDNRLALRECQAFTEMKCEIQIRSVLQHAWAEIEHDIGYKNEIAIPKELRRSFSRIAGLLELADKEFDDIRNRLISYQEEVQERIYQEDFLDREIDSVLLNTIVNTDVRVHKLSEYIATLMGKPLKNNSETHYVEFTICGLASLGIRTVEQINSLITTYVDTATQIATEYLKNYKKQENGKDTDPLIAFFYLCYAVLLTEKCTKEEIGKYIEENNIGLRKDREETVEKLYELGKKINKP